jgi:hypothetical protein
MKKLYELGAKTGLNTGEVNRLTRFGLLGLLAVGLAAIVGCFSGQKAATSAQPAKPGTLVDLANSVNSSTAPATQDKNCGPYPGYPCGTRYYTVSHSDIKRLA